MASMVYYPGFSVFNERWLKYALMYLDEICPIVPDRNRWECEINEMTRLVNSETDLLKPCIPEWEELNNAAVTAASTVKAFLCSPDLLAYALCGVADKSKGEDILQEWRMSDCQNTQIYGEKIAYMLIHLLCENQLCWSTKKGIMLPSKLSNMYMSILANEIAIQRGLDVITDDSECNRVILRHEALARSMSEFAVAQSEIEYYLPCGIDEISLKRIVNMRNDPDFRAIRNAFSDQIELMIQKREHYDYQHTFDEMLYAKKYWLDYLLKAFDGLAVVAASVVSFGALKDGFQGEDFMSLALGAYTDWRATHSLYRSVRRIRTDYTEKRLARKYVAQIRNLNAPIIMK